MLTDKLLQNFLIRDGREGMLYSLPALEADGVGPVSKLPVCLRVVLESLMRNCDGERVTVSHLKSLANWQPNAAREDEIPFVVARVVLQDFTGVPLLADLAAMREAAARSGKSPDAVEPLTPVDLVVDHSVQVDHYARPDAAKLNMEIEFARNRERYQFLKWGAAAFNGFQVVPPGVGIVHQVNLEHLARSVMVKDGVYYPDTLVGTDSHTTMINGVGVVGWGVGGIEAEAAMLGQPVYMLTPDVVGMRLSGKLQPGVTATDLVLTVTEILRRANVVGKFVEFFGEGARSLSAPDRATIGNMAPEYGATMGFFPLDEKTLEYFRATGRDEKQVAAIESYHQAQGIFGIPDECEYSQVVPLDLSEVVPSVAGPKRPQDRIPLRELKQQFAKLISLPKPDGGYGKAPDDLHKRIPVAKKSDTVGDGDVMIAAITSCTNTSNPGVLLAAGLLAKKAHERGLKPNPRVKTSLAPGSRVVTDYLENAGLMPHLKALGFDLVGYGCTTCIGNSGPLDADYEKALADNDLVGVSVLSGNRNFEARVHQSIRANFLMSPPLVVAFALAGRIDLDMENELLGTDQNGKPVFLKELWPDSDEIAKAMAFAIDPENYRKRYAGADGSGGTGGGSGGLEDDAGLWRGIESGGGARYEWRDDSTYIRKPPFFDLDESGAVRGARALALLGDSVTTDHISPAGAIKPSSPAGRYLSERGVKVLDFNSYGARRGNHEVMMRGTFANVRIRNLMTEAEGGVTVHHPSGETLSIYDAAEKYRAENVGLLVFAGREYGTGSSRDWAAKGTRLLGVQAVVARGYERIHRSNLIGMGVLPCQFGEGESIQSLQLRGDEMFDLEVGEIAPRARAVLKIRRADGTEASAELLVRIDTPTEAEYFKRGGILPHVLSRLAA